MTDLVVIDVVLIFVRWSLPVIAVLSLVLSLRPALFMDLEKKLSKGLGHKGTKRKTIALLEKQNMDLQNALQRNNQLVGLLCFVLAVVIIVKI